MSFQRVAIIFDNQTRPETTGFYCRRALGELVEVEHFLPEELSQIPENKFDLFINVDDGLRYHLPDHLRPAACWVIDTHMDFDWSMEKASRFDWVFAAQSEGAKNLNKSGIQSAQWLPLACDPDIHRRHKKQQEIDICFIGNLIGGERQRLLEEIAGKYPRHFIGQKYFKEMAQIYSTTKIVFNKSVKNDLNMRVFEALSCGAFLLTNDLSNYGQNELFNEGQHLATYSSDEELFDKMNYYLTHDKQRQEIAQQGHQLVQSKHTYLHRMQELLQSIDSQQNTSVLVPDIPYKNAGIKSNTNIRQVSRLPLPDKSVSACLLSWNRPDNVAQIVNKLKQFRFIDDILIWNNNPNMYLEFDIPGVKVIQSKYNLVTYGRFQCADQARHSIVYTQDDDCIVHNIPELYESFLANPERISHGLKPTHLIENHLNVFGSAQMALVGWGAFFKKEWTQIFDLYTKQFGEDQLLIRKADRIFSLLLNRRHQSQMAQVTDLDGASGPEALSVREDHLELSEQAIDRTLTLLHTKPSTDNSLQEESKQDKAYFDFPRPEVVALIPEDAKSVLDLGCGSGRLGESLKLRQSVKVTGVELNPSAATQAQKRINRVVQTNIEDLSDEFKKSEFDCVVCADVLEHLCEPDKTLKQVHGWLREDGVVIASIPNTRNHSILSGLIDGNWTYERAGLLDQTHYRFFTRREIEKLFFRSGFEIQELQVVPGPGFQEWQEQGQPGKVNIGNLHIEGISQQDAQEFYVYQYLVKAKRIPKPDYGLTSIIIVTHNQLPYTQQCIDSIRMRTDDPYELILIDNGSTDGTPGYLNSLADARTILNSTNQGFPAAVNQGIKLASGKNILLLNNDTLVTTGWLQKMLQQLHSSPEIGLVGPVSNNVSGPQQIPISYTDLTSMDGFAWDWGKQHHRQQVDESRLVGFCMLMRRNLIDQIGLLDERFGIGCFEDDDYCRRAREKGLRTVIAVDSFIHHFGSQSFRSSGVDFAQILKENEQKYFEKWESKPDQHAFNSEPQPDSNETIRLSLCMIVRDNESTIGPCLESIKPWVDEVIIVDTGSIDRTPEICQEFGARMFEFPWCDDFSAARNESVKHAKGEWIFWMDSDDTIPYECGKKLRQLADQKHAENIFGYIMQVHCPSFEADASMTSVDHVKMFRNLPELRFEHKIHEQIIPAIRRAGGDVAWTDLHVIHSGSDHSPEGRARKLVRDYKLLELDLADRPEHPFVLFNLGMTYADDEKYPEAIEYLKRCLKVSKPEESNVRKAYALLINALSQIEQQNEAWEYCLESLKHYPDDKELLFRQAMLHHHFGRLREAEQTYLRVINDKTERYFTSIDVGLSGYKSRHNLAAVYEEMGQLQDAEAQWRLVIKENPNYSTGWKNLGETLIKQGKTMEVKQHIEQMQTQEHLQLSSQLLKARFMEHQGETESAIQILNEIKAEWPDELEPTQELSRLLFEKHSPKDALIFLQELSEKEPPDASTLHNLGTAYLIDKQFNESISAYHRSIEIRPDSSDTWLLLGHAFRNIGDTLHATNAWQETLKLAPNHKEAKQLLANHGITASS